MIPRIHIIEHAWMWRDLGLSLAECRVYAFLYALTRAGKGWSSSLRDLADNIGISKSQVCQVLTDLSLRALVTKRDNMWIAIRPEIVQPSDTSVHSPDTSVQPSDTFVHSPDTFVRSPDTPQSLRDFARDNKEIEENKKLVSNNNESQPTNNPCFSISEKIPQPDDSGFGEWWLAFASPRSEDRAAALYEWERLSPEEHAKVMLHTADFAAKNNARPPAKQKRPNWYLHDRLWDVTEQVQPPTYYEGIAIDNALREGIHLVQVRVPTEQGFRFKITSLADAQRHNLQITNPNYK